MIGIILIVFVAGGKEERLGAMLMFQDVHKDSTEPRKFTRNRANLRAVKAKS